MKTRMILTSLARRYECKCVLYSLAGAASDLSKVSHVLFHSAPPSDSFMDAESSLLLSSNVKVQNYGDVSNLKYSNIRRAGNTSMMIKGMSTSPLSSCNQDLLAKVRNWLEKYFLEDSISSNYNGPEAVVAAYYRMLTETLKEMSDSSDDAADYLHQQFMDFLKDLEDIYFDVLTRELVCLPDKNLLRQTVYESNIIWYNYCYDSVLNNK